MEKWLEKIGEIISWVIGAMILLSIGFILGLCILQTFSVLTM